MGEDEESSWMILIKPFSKNHCFGAGITDSNVSKRGQDGVGWWGQWVPCPSAESSPSLTLADLALWECHTVWPELLVLKRKPRILLSSEKFPDL